MAGSFYPVPYAEMHDQAFAHCQIFFTAAANADGPCFSPTVAFPPVRKTMDLWLGILYNPNYLIQTEILLLFGLLMKQKRAQQNSGAQ